MIATSFLFFLAVYLVEAKPDKSLDTSVFNTNVAPVFSGFKTNCSLSFELDTSTVDSQAKYLASNGVSVVLVEGLVGEGPSLGLCNSKILLKAWMVAAKKYNLKVIINIGELATPDLLNFVSYCKKVGVDAYISSLQLFYLSSTASGIVDNLEGIAGMFSDKCFFYEYLPTYTGASVDAREIHAEFTKRVPNYCGMKADLCTCLQIRGEGLLKKNQICTVTNYVSIRAAWTLGFKATVVPQTTIIPSVINSISDKVDAGDYKGAGSLQAAVNKLFSGALLTRQNDYDFVDVAGDKYFFKIISGINIGSTVLPISEASYQMKQEIEARSQAFEKKYPD